MLLKALKKCWELNTNIAGVAPGVLTAQVLPLMLSGSMDLLFPGLQGSSLSRGEGFQYRGRSRGIWSSSAYPAQIFHMWGCTWGISGLYMRPGLAEKFLMKTYARITGEKDTPELSHIFDNVDKKILLVDRFV